MSPDNDTYPRDDMPSHYEGTPCAACRCEGFAGGRVCPECGGTGMTNLRRVIYGWQRATPTYVHRPNCDGHCMDEGECYACYYDDWQPSQGGRSGAGQ